MLIIRKMSIFMRRCHSTATAVIGFTHKSFNEIPGPKSYPLLGSVPNYLPFIGKYDPKDVLKSGIIKFKEFGPVIKENLFGHEALFLYDPTDIETLFRNAGNTRRSHLTLGHLRKNSNVHANGGILVENGATWAQLRTGSQQALTTEAFEQFLPQLDKITVGYLEKIQCNETMQRVIETDFLLGLLSFNCDAVCYMLFDLHFDSLNDIFLPDTLTTRVIHSSTYFNRMMAPMDNGLMLWRLWPTPLYKKLKRCSEDVDYIPKREVEQRMKNANLVSDNGILNCWIKNGKMDPRTMTTILSDLLLAGIDTTSYTLAFTLYNLSTNKRVQDKVYSELRRLDPDLNDPVTISMDILSKATYMKRVVKESMRLFPVSVGTSRVLENPCIIGGYKIPSKITVITMNQVTCRLPEYVENPNEFIPERYETSSGFRKIRPFTSLPFGHGPRACIGRRIAESSMYLFLFRLLRRFEIVWTGDKDLGCVAHSITEPDGPLKFRFIPRME